MSTSRRPIENPKLAYQPERHDEGSGCLGPFLACLVVLIPWAISMAIYLAA